MPRNEAALISERNNSMVFPLIEEMVIAEAMRIVAARNARILQ
jgi:hypothetical protein